MEIQLRKFDMSEIKDDKVVVLIGKRDTGKSFLCKDILYYHKDIPVGQVISGTEGANQFYSKMVPKLFIHGEFNTQIVQNMLKRQKMLIDKINAGQGNIDPRSLRRKKPMEEVKEEDYNSHPSIKAKMIA